MSAILSTFGVDWHLLIVQIVNFAILVAALTWLLYKPVLKMVRERAQVVRKGVEDAEDAGRKLAAADGEAASRLGSAEKEAEEIVKRGRALGLAEKTSLIEEAEAQAARIAADAEAHAKEDAARVRRESEREIARLAILAAEKAMHKAHD
jgi:F-type H+-transporting ATPase subunit b